MLYFFFFSSRRRHTRFDCDWSSDVCSSDLELPAAINGLDLAQPVQISPGEQITFTVTPSKPVKAGEPVHVEYDLGGVHVIPDKDAIWKETLDPKTSESYLTTITVKAPASTFAVPGDDS